MDHRAIIRSPRTLSLALMLGAVTQVAIVANSHAEEFRTFPTFQEEQARILASRANLQTKYQELREDLPRIETQLKQLLPPLVTAWNALVRIDNKIHDAEQRLTQAHDPILQFQVIPDLKKQRANALDEATETAAVLKEARLQAQRVLKSQHNLRRQIAKLDVDYVINIGDNSDRLTPPIATKVELTLLETPNHAEIALLHDVWIESERFDRFRNQVRILGDIVTDLIQVVEALSEKQTALEKPLIDAEREWQSLNTQSDELYDNELIADALLESIDVGIAVVTSGPAIPLTLAFAGIYRGANAVRTRGERKLDEPTLPNELLILRQEVSIGGQGLEQGNMSRIRKARLFDDWEGIGYDYTMAVAEDVLFKATLNKVLRLAAQEGGQSILERVVSVGYPGSYWGFITALQYDASIPAGSPEALLAWYTKVGGQQLAWLGGIRRMMRNGPPSIWDNIGDAINSEVSNPGIKDAIKGAAISLALNAGKQLMFANIDNRRLNLEIEKALAEIKWFVIRNERRALHKEIATNTNRIRLTRETIGELFLESSGSSSHHRNKRPIQQEPTAGDLDSWKGRQLELRVTFSALVTDPGFRIRTTQDSGGTFDDLLPCTYRPTDCFRATIQADDIVNRFAGESITIDIRRSRHETIAGVPSLDGNPETVAFLDLDRSGIIQGYSGVESHIDDTHEIRLPSLLEDRESDETDDVPDADRESDETDNVPEIVSVTGVEARRVWLQYWLVDMTQCHSNAPNPPKRAHFYRRLTTDGLYALIYYQNGRYAGGFNALYADDGRGLTGHFQFTGGDNAIVSFDVMLLDENHFEGQCRRGDGSMGTIYGKTPQ